MATKQAEVIENPPLVFSSEEEEEESGSSAEESETSGENSKKYENSRSAVTLPESSKAKRPLEKGDDEPNKKMKTSMTEHVKKPAATDEKVKKISGEEAKKMFQRLFSETDEIALLQGILDFSGDISEDMDAFCDYVKKLINFNANKSQIVTKIRRLKNKFANIVKKSLRKGKGEDEIKFSKDVDQKAFDLWRNIWGSEGVLACKSRKKLGGTPKEIKLAPKDIHSPKQLEEMQNPNANVVKNTTHLSSSSREMAWFFKAENVSVLGLDESTVTAGWDKVEDGPKKREMEEKLKKLKETQVELCLQRIALVDNATKMIFKDNASSS